MWIRLLKLGRAQRRGLLNDSSARSKKSIVSLTGPTKSPHRWWNYCTRDWFAISTRNPANMLIEISASVDTCDRCIHLFYFRKKGQQWRFFFCFLFSWLAIDPKEKSGLWVSARVQEVSPPATVTFPDLALTVSIHRGLLFTFYIYL